MKRTPRMTRLGALSLALLSPACGGDGQGGGGPPTSPTDPVGSIQLTVLTVNTPAGTGDYTVNISGVGDRAIAANARLEIADVPTGSRTVAVSGFPASCVLRSGSRNVNVSRGSTSTIDFIVVCSTGMAPSERIVFERNDDIQAMGLDGTGLENLTDHPANDEGPDVSPDGTRILFTSNGRDPANPTTREIWVMNADGSGQQRLVEGFNPAWSPDGTRIAFEQSVAGTRRDIFVMNADGTGIESVSNGQGDEELVSWSPDGGRLVFSDDGDGSNQDFDIFVINVDGTGRQRLVGTKNAWDMFPDWSPNGTKIVFNIFHDSGDVSIYLKDLNVQGFVRLTEGAEDWSPRWSPDGTRILFTSLRSGTWDIHAMEADGTGITRITTDPATDDGPNWWP